MIFRLNHVIRDYEWGSRTALPELLGIEATGSPLAELWLGAHPDSPAALVLADGVEPLDDWIAEHPIEALGRPTEEHFGPRLPYLLKVLAADRALSLQVHPTADRAREGFQEEERAGVPANARNRRYKDPFHKPEMVVAVTEFQALCGLRPVRDTLSLLRSLDVEHPDFNRLVSLLDPADEAGSLRAAFAFLLGEEVQATALVEAVTRACAARLAADPNGRFAEVEATIVQLARSYPGDPGVVVSLLLNRVTLQPGEALYLPAGNVHAYLTGTAVEVMATSDNVLRAGLTPKFVDVGELMSVVEFTPQPLPYVQPVDDGLVRRYLPGAEEFALAWVRVREQSVSLAESGARVLLSLGGELSVQTAAEPLPLRRGEAVFVPAAEPALTVSGTGSAVLVTVPVPDPA